MSFGSLYSDQSVNVLDGGLGTTLEDIFHEDIAHTPLWSAKSIDENSETLIQVHLSFLGAGARTILTSTYQCAFTTFERAGYSREDATRIMRKSVEVAREAKRRFCDQNRNVLPGDIRIALSLGPFGATLYPAQEFDGFYPPPYGPKAFSSSGQNENVFGDDVAQRESSIDALAHFHSERLQVFTSDRECWDAVDCIAFETVPLAREVKAIRRAMGMLGGAVADNGEWKPWWISTVFPGGHYPERKTPGGEYLSASEVLNAVLGEENDGRIGEVVRQPLTLPSGIGINCTGIEFLPDLLSDFERALNNAEEKARLGGRPWLVLYPNGGDVYDPVSRTWRGSNETQKGRVWGEQLGQIVDSARGNGTWGGILVGGCCRTGPAEIRALVDALRLPSAELCP
ncbi:hypothetical protein SERLA73DRAFT_181000 [Serpula lacrymans var. lacrymans S7.3]|uniref:Hcy-binding domain-containing protein n=2 Tax=Serpula lacrymans var. lacrymans TaxID=341189 RepID=F8PUA6_SERL3|nr:uncharacterized protein SERLADRAFT_466856 [Serpula lacrymans var. lacrymans S7.9]EGO00419.1 hypothetical protein SERLA73DRAFT_181000 [Serpula lacrymans var. lacrymans S7.3]EGO25977.1 hypothetical protein SERLADRAFT_466856 [Serpula lacrymans var. lacrymans S7.9]